MMTKRRAKMYAKTALLAGAAIVTTVMLDTMWNYTGSNVNTQSSELQSQLR